MEESRGRVLEIRENSAVIQIGTKRKTVSLRDDVKVKKGDSVIVFMNTIIGTK